jgi:membrane protein
MACPARLRLSRQAPRRGHRRLHGCSAETRSASADRPIRGRVGGPKIEHVSVGNLGARINTIQQTHAWIAFPLAVRQKYADDRGGSVAAAVTYYAFFSLFPLLIVATTVLGFIVHGDAAAQERLAHTALGKNPLLGHDLRVHALTGSTTALVLGLATSLWAGMRVFAVSESAARWIWYVAEPRFVGTLRARLRALQLLIVVGGAALVTTALAGMHSAASKAGAPASAALLVVSLAANFAASAGTSKASPAW